MQLRIPRYTYLAGLTCIKTWLKSKMVLPLARILRRSPYNAEQEIEMESKFISGTPLMCVYIAEIDYEIESKFIPAVSRGQLRYTGRSAASC